jgi:hypothetical protein
MNPFTHVLRARYLDTRSTGSRGESAALYTILKILEGQYAGGCDGNPWRYVRDAILTFSGQNPFGVWLSESFNTDIDRYDRGQR